MARPTVLVYREWFLPPSETFVRDHVAALTRWEPVTVSAGVSRPGLTLPGHPTISLGDRRAPSGRVVDGVLRRVGTSAVELQARQLRRAIKRLKPDVIHAHFGPDGYVAFLAARGLGIPVVVTFHGYDATTYAEALRELGGAAAAMIDGWDGYVAGIDAAIAVSEAIKLELIDRGMPAEKITVIPCGVDVDRIQPVAVAPDGPVVFVGRLVEKKGCGDLIAAAGRAASRPVLEILGDGPLMDDLQHAAAEAGVDAMFCGVATRDEVRTAMARSSIVAMPSKRAVNGDMEGFGMVAVEAAATGRPVLAYDSGGLGEAVEDGVSGVVVPEGDVDALAAGLDSLLSSTGPLRELALSARGRAERVALKQQVAQVEDLYDTVAR